MFPQILGKCPTVSIDKTDGCQVFLSKDSLQCEIITAKSSEMNICIPPPPGEKDFVSPYTYVLQVHAEHDMVCGVEYSHSLTPSFPGPFTRIDLLLKSYQ